MHSKYYADTLTFGEYIFTIKHDYTLGWSPKAKEDQWPQAGGLIIQTAPDEFVVGGSGIVISFLPKKVAKKEFEILTIEEGKYNGDTWIPGRILNGDESHQGRHLRLEMGNYGIQKLKLYRYN